MAYKTDFLTATFTRPADTNTYAAGDAVSNSTTVATPMSFTGAARMGSGGGFIKNVILASSSNPTLKGQFELWVCRATIAAASINDNAAAALTDAESLTVIDVVPLVVTYVGNAGADGAGNCLYIAKNVDIPYDCASGSSTLYNFLITRNAYVPISAEVFQVALEVVLE